MLAVAFDTLKLARKLESAGMPSKQAQDTSVALSESFVEWLSMGNIATREDVQGVRADVQRLETKLAETKADILKWLFGAIGAQTLAQAAILYGLMHH